MICYAFPLADEAKDFLTHCTEKEYFEIGRLRLILSKFRKRKVLVALVGMGPKNASQSVEILFSHFRIRALILSGYGGALVPQLKLGNVVLSDNYSSNEILPFVKLLSGFNFGRFHTAAEVISTPRQKEDIARGYNVQVVDMETAPVAKLASHKQVPFVAIRAISDQFEEDLPIGAMNASYLVEQDAVTPLRLLNYLALHPKEIMPFSKFVKRLPIARKALTSFLIQITDEFPKHW